MLVINQNNNDLLVAFPSIFPDELYENDKIFHSNQVDTWIEEVEAQYHFEFEAILLNPPSNHYPSIVKIEHTQPLHYAAATGDLHGAKYFLHQGIDVNSRDHLNSTPLHVAVIMNQPHMIDFLMSQGADVNSLAYEFIDCFSLALIKGHYKIAKQLLTKYQIDINEDIINNLVDAFWETIQDEFYDDLSDLVDIIKHLVLISDESLLLSVDENESIPLSIAVALSANNIADAAAREIVLNLVDYIDAHDCSASYYLDAKLLLHVLPVSDIYEIEYANKHRSLISSEGHYGHYTVSAAEQLVERYVQSLCFEDNTNKKDIFLKIKNILHETINFIDTSPDLVVMNEYFQNHEANNIILLPTGWMGHFVVTIIDNKNGYLVVCNTGMAYEGNESGSIFYKIHNPENLTPKVINDIFQNLDQFYLEYDLNYQLGLEKLYVLPESPQVTGNCAWRSIEISVEALAFLSLIEQGNSYEEAGKIAHEWYADWNQFLTREVLNDYLSHDPRLEIQALSDILIFNHPSLFDKTLPIAADEWERGKLIIESMSSPKYIDQFPSIAMDLKYARPEFINLMKYYGLQPCEKPLSHHDLFDNLDLYDLTTDFKKYFSSGIEKVEALKTQDIIQSTNDILMSSCALTDVTKNIGCETNFEYAWQKDADPLLVLYDIP